MSEKEAVMKVDKDLVDKAVKLINEKASKTVYKGYLEIGEYLLLNFFNNDIKEASSKNRKKAVSFQELRKRPDLEVHPSSLSRMVRVASQERYFIQRNVNTDGLSYSHKIELIKLDNDEKKLQLVEMCIKEKMPYIKFAEIVFETRQKGNGEKEPSPLKLISSANRLVDRLIEGSQIQTLLSEPEKLERMRPKTRTVFRERTSNLLEKMSTTTKECNKLIKTFDEIEEKKKLEKEKKEREKEKKQAKKEKGKAETKAEEEPKAETEPETEEKPETEAETKEEEKPEEG